MNLSVRLIFLWIFPGCNGGKHTRGVLSGPLRPFPWRSTWPDLAERDEQNSFWELDWYWLLLIRFLSSLQGAEFRHFSERKAKPPPADRYMKLANWVWGAPRTNPDSITLRISVSNYTALQHQSASTFSSCAFGPTARALAAVCGRSFKAARKCHLNASMFCCCAISRD